MSKDFGRKQENKNRFEGVCIINTPEGNIWRADTLPSVSF